MVTGVLALVGTRKGLFLLRGDDARRTWQAEGPLLGGRDGGEVLRALPVADLLFNERGEWNRHLNVFVDGREARERGGPACPLTGAREILVVAMLSGG